MRTRKILAAMFATFAIMLSQASHARELVFWEGDEEAGSIVITTGDRQLYYVVGDGHAIAYDIAVGRPGTKWFGTTRVTRKAHWPNWYPTDNMRKRNPRLPKMVKGGEDNPLGSRAIYLADAILRIHGTNEPDSIGNEASSGCFRMRNEDVEHLYDFVDEGATVLVVR